MNVREVKVQSDPDASASVISESGGDAKEPSSPPVEANSRQGMSKRRRLRDWHVVNWCLLGWYDFVFQHRRTMIGPFWQTVQMAVWAAGLVIVFGSFHADRPDYIPYVVSGLVVWGLLSSCLQAGTGVFTSNASLILNIPNPLTLYVVRSLSLITVRFGFQLLVFVPVAIYYHLPFNTSILWIVPGTLLILLCFGSSMMVLGVIGVRMRDLEHIISAAMRFLFFTTPIFWIPDEGTLRFILTLVNPLAWFLDLIRLPLLGEAPSTQTFVLCIIVTLLSMAAAFLVHRRFGRFVPTWL